MGQDTRTRRMYCDANATTPLLPRVTAAMAVPAGLAPGAVRFSLGRRFTAAGLEELLARTLRTLAALNPR